MCSSTFMQSTPTVRNFNKTLGGILRVLHYDVYTLTYGTEKGNGLDFEHSSPKEMLESIKDEIKNLCRLQKRKESLQSQAQTWGSETLHADLKAVRKLCATSNSKIERIGEQTKTGKTTGDEPLYRYVLAQANKRDTNLCPQPGNGQHFTLLSTMAPKTRQSFLKSFFEKK